ncbi:MAG: polyprenyl synthetase family protein [Verrucomicrobiae bacterium]|nr:polyprenyl synthetase family protein [Verrucomicrobiae bacterium]
MPAEDVQPPTAHKAMRHSMFAGGKRLRPILCLAATEACGGDIDRAMPLACAAEAVHTYSLMHDDLPCMDDDDFRRGHPTCHKVFGEAVAVLAGDALQALAFEMAAGAEPSSRFGVRDYIIELASTAGSLHLIAGQIMDMEGEGTVRTEEGLRAIHERKTMALLTSSVRLGAMSSGANDAQLEALTRFGKALGLAFQIIDDILDVTQTSEKLGKSAGKDVAAEKATYPSILGMEASRAEASRLTAEAYAALDLFGDKAARLRSLAEYLLNRDY